MPPGPIAARNLEVVRSLWDAMRTRDVECARSLVDADVEWVRVLIDGPPLRGREDLMTYFEEIVSAGAVADAHALSFEAVGDEFVVLSGALRHRRPDNWLETLEHWWVYRLRDGLIVRAQVCATRVEALAATREHTEPSR